jgi:hypothetical protein
VQDNVVQRSLMAFSPIENTYLRSLDDVEFVDFAARLLSP